MIGMVHTFTSRYGNRLPSSLTICNDHCEGMGCYPEHDPKSEDGWTFLTCSTCNGTGKCSTRETLRRVPRWFWSSAVFVFTGPARGKRDTPLDLWLRFQATFIADLGGL